MNLRNGSNLAVILWISMGFIAACAAFTAYFFLFLDNEVAEKKEIRSAICSDLNGDEMTNTNAIVDDGEVVGYAFDLNGTRSEIYGPNAGNNVAGPINLGRHAFHLYRCSVLVVDR